MSKEKIKMYLYTRVSTTMQIDGYSLDAQKTKMKAFCDYNEYEIAGEYEDAGKTGKSIEGRITFPTRYSSYLVTSVIHPHGIQDVPRSILFGVDIPDFNKETSKEKRLIKSYWSRYDLRYESYFEDTKLFIMYGMSISKTDGWWLDQIFECISKNGAELIIYKYGCENEERIKEQFVQACIRNKNVIEADIEEVKRHIFVVTFEKNDTYFLGLEKRNAS